MMLHFPMVRAAICLAMTGTALALAASAAAAKPSPSGVPEPVYAAAKARFATAHAALYARDDNAPALPQPPDAMFRKVDINRDGTPDWLVDYERASSVIGGLCGTGGCLKQIYVSGPDGSFTLAFAAQAIGVRVKAAKPTLPVVLADMHGLYCGGTGSDACVIAMRWESTSGRLVPVANPQGATVIRAFDTLVDAPVTAPRAILAQRDTVRATCQKAGFTLREEEGESVAYPFLDINGDTILDWIVEPYCMPQETDDPANTPDRTQHTVPVLDNAVIVSNGTDFATAWSGPSTLMFSLVGSRTALLVSQDDASCAESAGNVCGVKQYVWDRATNRLVVSTK